MDYIFYHIHCSISCISCINTAITAKVVNCLIKSISIGKCNPKLHEKPCYYLLICMTNYAELSNLFTRLVNVITTNNNLPERQQ